MLKGRSKSILVTIGILAWMRDMDTIKAINSVYKQLYRPIEVILVDGSPDYRISEKVLKKFPETHIIRIHRNFGCPEGRNLIFANAQGEIILCIDDDSIIGKNTINEIVEVMRDNDKIGIVACNVIDNGNKKNVINKKQYKEVFHFNGQCAIRKKILKETGFYPDNFLRQGEEAHLGLRVLNSGYKIIYLKKAVINHFPSPLGRNSGWFLYYTTRNGLQTVFELLPYYIVPFGLLYKVAILVLSGIKKCQIHYVFLGILSFFYQIPNLFKRRRPISFRILIKAIKLAKCANK